LIVEKESLIYFVIFHLIALGGRGLDGIDFKVRVARNNDLCFYATHITD
jgi:hypothetical protein